MESFVWQNIANYERGTQGQVNVTMSKLRRLVKTKNTRIHICIENQLKIYAKSMKGPSSSASMIFGKTDINWAYPSPHLGF